MYLNKLKGTEFIMNKIYLNNVLVKEYENLKQFKLTINGDNNVLKLYDFEGPALVYIYIDGDYNKFKFGKNNIVRNDLSINYWRTADQRPLNSEIIIGNNNFFNGSSIVFIAPLTKSLKIGNGNLFAGNICFWARNDHIIYDCKTKKRLNDDQNIIVGNNNWICQNVSFLPGGKIKNNSIVAYGSLVNKGIKESHVLLAGTPVNIKKSGVNWSRASKIENVDFKNNLNVKNIN